MSRSTSTPGAPDAPKPADQVGPDPSLERRRLLLAVIVTELAGALAVVHLFDLIPSLKLDTPLLVISVIAALPWLAGLFPQLAGRIASIKALGAEIQLVQEKVERQSQVLLEQQKILNRLTVFSMEADIFDTLENLEKQPTF